MDTRMYIAGKLKTARKSAKLNVEQVATVVDKSPKTISAWEVGHGEPSADCMVMLCKLYGVDVDYFYGALLNDDENLERIKSAYAMANGAGKAFMVEVAENVMENKKYHDS